MNSAAAAPGTSSKMTAGAASPNGLDPDWEPPPPLAPAEELDQSDGRRPGAWETPF